MIKEFASALTTAHSKGAEEQREVDARIAENHAPEWPHSYSVDAAGYGKIIAAAIRAGGK